jgi:hypothetical protein
MAAGRKRGVLETSGIWPIGNRPQDAILPHNKIVAAREETKCSGTTGDPKIVAARDETKM